MKESWASQEALLSQALPQQFQATSRINSMDLFCCAAYKILD